LLIDDGSIDQSPAIGDEYAKRDARVKVYHKENGGVSSARNLGLDHAKGEWITFIDSDDKISCDYLNDVENCVSDIVFKNYEKVLSDQVIVALSMNEIQNNRFPLFVNTYITTPLLRCPWGKFFKRELISNLRFLSDMKIGEDAWFVFNYLARCKSFALSHQGTYFVRVDERPDDVKYAITVDYAVQSLYYLKGAYHQLVQVHGIQKAKFLEYIGYFKRISKADWASDKSRWYCNQHIKSLYDYVWTDLSGKQKLRLIVARILKK
jgi:glycosyltransferase involved in cell wall biosynthesis